jgi:hypothetical protein
MRITPVNSAKDIAARKNQQVNVRYGWLADGPLIGAKLEKRTYSNEHMLAVC